MDAKDHLKLKKKGFDHKQDKSCDKKDKDGKK